MDKLIILQVLGGVLALGLGAELIVRSSINLANIYKVSGYFIGFTIIALGTSLPELASTIQALQVANSLNIALGNIIGSNITNILLIIGMISIIETINFPKNKKNESILLVLITLLVIGIFYYLTNIRIGSVNIIVIATVLLSVFFGYLLWQFKTEESNVNNNLEKKTYSQFISYILLMIGLVFLIQGSKYFIIGSEQLAKIFNIPDEIIGLTLVALGTSLPELATGITAALKKESNLAVGTILGSNVYNIVGIFSVILLMEGYNFPKSIDVFIGSLLFMTFVTIIFALKIRFGLKIFNLQPYKIEKKSGILFLILYIFYITYSYLN